VVGGLGVGRLLGGLGDVGQLGEAGHRDDPERRLADLEAGQRVLADLAGGDAARLEALAVKR
jgi:hypothetical protein